MFKQTLLLTLTICAAASLSIPNPAYAQLGEFKLTASDGAAGDEFGWSVSISGDDAIVGAFADNVFADSSGSAYVFTRSGTSWAQQAKLVPSDGARIDEFGWSVSISGDYLVVGARLDGDNGGGSGSAYGNDGDFLKSNGGDVVPFFEFDNQSGRVRIDIGVAAGDPAGVTGSGALANIQFRALRSGNSPVRFVSNPQMRDPDNNSIIINAAADGIVEIE